MALLGFLYSLRDFLRLANWDKVPDHSWLSKTRSRLPHEAHEKVFGWVLNLVAERGLVKGERIGVDSSTMEANAALRTIVRRDSGETYRAMLTRMAQESGVETPTRLVRLDRKRKGKKLSNEEWTSTADPDARIARMKDGSTHLAYKPEHAVDLDTGVIVAAPIHPADEGDTTTLDPTLEAAARNLADIGLAPTPAASCELVADYYHSREGLKDTRRRRLENADIRVTAATAASAGVNGFVMRSAGHRGKMCVLTAPKHRHEDPIGTKPERQPPKFLGRTCRGCQLRQE